MSGKRKRLQIEEQVSPNLIPMIDIMFLLLLFFMLGADMGQRDIEDVVLPEAQNVKEDKEEKGKKAKDRLTINIIHRFPNELACARHEGGRLCLEERHWKVSVRGRDFTEPDKMSRLLKEEAERYRGPEAKEGASDRRVMVRADGLAPYGLIQDVMGTCAKVGIYQIECGAAKPVEARAKTAEG